MIQIHSCLQRYHTSKLVPAESIIISRDFVMSVEGQENGEPVR